MGKEVLITISQQEYDALIEDQKILRALEAAGVDNWEGYENISEYLDD